MPGWRRGDLGRRKVLLVGQEVGVEESREGHRKQRQGGRDRQGSTEKDQVEETKAEIRATEVAPWIK